MVCGVLRPSSDGSFIKVISVKNGLEGPSIRKPRDDYHDQLDRLAKPFKHGPLPGDSRSSGRPYLGNILVFEHT